MEEIEITVAKPVKQVPCWNCGTSVNQQDYKTIDFIPKCSKCGALYPEKPKLEARLSINQDNYLQNRSQANLDRLFNPLYDMIFNIICSKLKKSGTSRERDDIEDMVQWTLATLISYYKKKPTFKINGSFSAYLEKMVLFPLYNPKDKLRGETEISLNAKIDGSKTDAKKEITLLDKLSEESVDGYFEDSLLNRLSQSRTTDNAVDFLKKIFNVLFYYHYNNGNPKALSKTLEMVCLYKHFINKKEERYFRELNKTCSPDLKENFDKSMAVFKKYLREGAILNG